LETTFVAYHGDELYVFVCYAHADVERVYPEMDWLHGQGVRIWCYEGISAGKNWRETIGDSLLAADQILFFVSYALLNSDHCNREIKPHASLIISRSIRILVSQRYWYACLALLLRPILVVIG